MKESEKKKEKAQKFIYYYYKISLSKFFCRIPSHKYIIQNRCPCKSKTKYVSTYHLYSLASVHIVYFNLYVANIISKVKKNVLDYGKLDKTSL